MPHLNAPNFMKKNHFKLFPIYTYHNFTQVVSGFLAKYRDFYCYNIRLDQNIDLLVSIISLFIFNTFSQKKENHLFLSLLKAWTTSLTSSVSKIFFSRCISLSSSPFFSFISSYLCLALSSSKHYKTFCSFSLKFLGLCSLSLFFMFFSRTEVIFE